MISFASIFSPLYFIYFFVAIFVAFYIPASVIIGNRLNNDPLTKKTLTLIFGIVMWGLWGFFVGIIHARWLSYLYILLFVLLWLFKGKWRDLLFEKKKLKLDRRDLLIGILIILGTLSQLLSIFYAGVPYKGGIYFCCGVPDGLYHVALVDQLIHNFPPNEPGAAGIIVQNYHYFSNLIFADLIRVFRLPLFNTIFQYSTTAFSLLIGLSALVFAKTLKLKKSFIILLIFFLYFSGDILYLLLFALGKGFNIHYVFLYDPTKLWTSPPRVFAIPILFAGLSLFNIWQKSKSLFIGSLSAIVFSTLIAIKAYMGFFILAGLSFLIIYFLIKKDFKSIKPWILTFIISFFLYAYVNKGAGGLIFVGTWRFENFISQPIFDLTSVELARRIYADSGSVLRIIQYEAIYAFLYILVLFGTLNLGFIQNKKSLSLFPRELNIVLISAIFVSLFIGFFFIQKTGGANSSQFLITAEIVGCVYAALAVYYWLINRSNLIKSALLLLILSLTMPRVISESKSNFLNIYNKGGLIISRDELAALDFLRTKTPPNSIILVDNNPLPKKYGLIKGKKTELPNPDHRDFAEIKSYYIPPLSQRLMFLDGNTVVKDHGIDEKERAQAANTIFYNSDANLVWKKLIDNKIDYIYTNSKDNLSAPISPEFLIPVFNNPDIKILMVKKDK